MKLKNYVPFFISNIKEFQKIYDSEQIEIDNLDLNIKDLLNQFFINSATWGIDRWEEFVGIKRNSSKSIEERRARVLSKLRGQGTTTIEMIKNVCRAYVKNVDVIEHNNIYAFDIKLRSSRGFPYSLTDLYETIDEIKPAHLGAKFKLVSITNMNIFYSSILNTGETITVYPYRVNLIETKGNLNVALTNDLGVETITIYPK